MGDSGEIAVARVELAILLIKKDFVVRVRLKSMSIQVTNMVT